MLGANLQIVSTVRPMLEARRRTADRRRIKRVRLEFNAQVQVEGRRLRVTGLDAHRAGARITAAQPLLPGALVLFQIDASKFAAYAAVRSCGRGIRDRYEIGLEFLVPAPVPSAGPAEEARPWA